MNFCCEHKSVQDFVAELLDEVRHAEHADVTVDADHGLLDGVSRKNTNFFSKENRGYHIPQKWQIVFIDTFCLSKAVVVNAADEISHESISDFNIDAGENELIEIKDTGAESNLLLFLLDIRKYF